MMRNCKESIVEDAALDWFGELGYAVGQGPRLAPGEPAAEPACASHADRRSSYGEVVLAGRLREAIPLKQPEISRRTFSRSFCPGSHGNWKAWPIAGHFHGHFVRLQKGENGNLTVCSRNSASNFPNMGSSSLHLPPSSLQLGCRSAMDFGSSHLTFSNYPRQRPRDVAAETRAPEVRADILPWLESCA